MFVLVAVLSSSRRLFVRAFLHERYGDWREGIAAAFQRFGGVPRTVLGDNARALVCDRGRATGTVHFHPAYLAFCRDWDVQPRACAPYRARTKGKTESGVKYVKRSALAGRCFASFAALEQHLAAWMLEADARVLGTPHEVPRALCASRAGRAAALARAAAAARHERLRRRVTPDAFVDLDTVRYSVPYQLVREDVEVAREGNTVRIFHGPTLVTHRRVSEPQTRVLDPRTSPGSGAPRPRPVDGTRARYGRALVVGT